MHWTINESIDVTKTSHVLKTRFQSVTFYESFLVSPA